MSEARDHEQLLHEGVYVADATQVFDAHKASRRLHLVEESYGPII